jgi:hypothetical protein
MNIILRGSIDPNILVEPARAIAHELDPEDGDGRAART